MQLQTKSDGGSGKSKGELLLTKGKAVAVVVVFKKKGEMGVVAVVKRGCKDIMIYIKWFNKGGVIIKGLVTEGA